MAEVVSDEAGLELEAHDRRIGLQRSSTSGSTPRSADADVQETGDDKDLSPAAKPSFQPLNTSVTRTTEGGAPYSVFSSREKWLIVGLSALAGIFR